MTKKILRIVFLLIFLLPTHVYGAASVSMQDTVAGLGGDARLSGFAAMHQMQIIVLPPTHKESTIDVTTDASGGATVHIPGQDITEAGSYRIVVQGNDEASAKATFTVEPDSIDGTRSMVTASPGQIAADGQDASTVVVHLVDHYGNPLAGRPVQLIASETSDRVSAIDRETNQNGDERFSVAAQIAGHIQLRAIDLLSTTVLDASASIIAGTDGVGGEGNQPVGGNALTADIIDQAHAQNGAFDVLNRFIVTVEPKDLKVGEVGNLTIEAVDRNGNTVENYTGTVAVVVPTDTNAVLPGLGTGDNPAEGSVTFTPKNLGRKFLPLSISFSQTGDQTVRVEDRTDPQNIIAGSEAITIAGNPGAQKPTIEITHPQNNTTINTLNITVEGIGPKYANLQITGGQDDVVTGESDATGNFSIPVTLKAGKHEFTLRVKDQSGRYDSGDIDLTLDTDPPKLSTITFTPDKPDEGVNVFVSVQSEPALPSITMQLGSQTVPLVENDKAPGTYQAIVVAPAAGDYQPAFDATDAAGNTVEVRQTLTVGAQGLPKVRNVTVTVKGNGVELHWDPITSEPNVTYRVYVGEDPKDLLSIDTKQSVPGAALSGLKAGTTYTFQVTAVAGNRESAEKSDPVTAVPLGLSLTAAPGDGAVTLTWAFPDATPLSGFRLKYGVGKDQYTEERIFNGAARTFTVRDLINGVDYFFLLEPITITGDVQTGLAATADALPAGSGFHPSAPDQPVTYNPNLTPPPPIYPHQNPSSGMPPLAWWLAGAATIAAVAFEWHRRRTLRLTADFMKMMERKYRNP